jgi:hypothetical protein
MRLHRPSRAGRGLGDRGFRGLGLRARPPATFRRPSGTPRSTPHPGYLPPSLRDTTLHASPRLPFAVPPGRHASRFLARRSRNRESGPKSAKSTRGDTAGPFSPFLHDRNATGRAFARPITESTNMRTPHFPVSPNSFPRSRKSSTDAAPQTHAFTSHTNQRSLHFCLGQ